MTNWRTAHKRRNRILRQASAPVPKIAQSIAQSDILEKLSGMMQAASSAAKTLIDTGRAARIAGQFFAGIITEAAIGRGITAYRHVIKSPEVEQ